MPPTRALFLVIFGLSLAGSFTAALPTVLFSSNVTTLEAGASAKLTCQLVNYEQGNEEYLVQFYNEYQWLGDYAISVYSGHRYTVFSNETSPLLTSHALSWTFPIYEIAITPSMGMTGKYWCKLYQGNPQMEILSEHLSLTVTSPPPRPYFTSSKPSEDQWLAKCAVSVTGLHLSGQAYSVQFRSDAGPKSVNLLGEYSFKSNRFEEFQSFPVPPWTSLSHGASTSWPRFSLLATGTGSLNGTWWCVLAVGVQGAPDYREITSRRVHL